MAFQTIPQLLEKQGALSSRQIATHIVDKFGVSHSAARKRLERAVRNGSVVRFVSLKGNQFLYCLPNQQIEARRMAERKLRRWKPRLYRLFRALGEAKILTLWETSRITALSPKSISFKKLLSEIEILDLASQKKFDFEEETYQFLISKSLKASGNDLENLLKNYCKQLRDEESFIYITRRWLIRNRLARDFGQSGFRRRLFDSLGRSISPRFSLVIFDVNVRRSVSHYEMQGFIERVYKFISSRASKFPVYSFFIAKDFTRKAWKLGESRKIKMIRSRYVPHYRVHRRPGGLLLVGTEILDKDLKYWIMVAREHKELKHITQMKGLSFEYVVALAFRQHDYEIQEIRKEYFIENGEITEKRAGRTFTDIDIQMLKENATYEILLCECKNWNQLVDREGLLKSIEKLNRVVAYLRTEKFRTLGKKLMIKVIFIGSCREDDVKEAEQRATFDVEILTSREFSETYCQAIKELRRYQWLFE